MPNFRMLNIGCGATFHSDWINVDVASSDPCVRALDICNGLPYASESIDFCYSSHVLEHLRRLDARNLLVDCRRVLKREGVIRLVVPDLESLVRDYLSILEEVTGGKQSRELDYDWIMLELLDQTVRSFPGGEMADFLKGLNENNRSFVRSRIGIEAKKYWEDAYNSSRTGADISLRKVVKYAREKIAGWLVYVVAGQNAYDNFRTGLFRDRGEIHQWMYDRFSLSRLLKDAGFVNIKVCSAAESGIPDFDKYSLDILDGEIRKPDSLYIEASKP